MLKGGAVWALGTMSGTSLDGVDAAVVRLEGSGLDARAELLHFHTRAYGEPLRESLRKLCDPAASDVESLCGMNVYMAELFAEAVLEAVRDAGLSMSEVDFVSSHGQTVWHMPEPPSGRPHLSRSTLQIGDLSPRVGQLRRHQIAQPVLHRPALAALPDTRERSDLVERAPQLLGTRDEAQALDGVVAVHVEDPAGDVAVEVLAIGHGHGGKAPCWPHAPRRDGGRAAGARENEETCLAC